MYGFISSFSPYATPRVCSLPAAAAADGRSLSLKFSTTRASHKFIAGSNIIPNGCVQSLVFFRNKLTVTRLSFSHRTIHIFHAVFARFFVCLFVWLLLFSNLGPLKNQHTKSATTTAACAETLRCEGKLLAISTFIVFRPVCAVAVFIIVN